MRQGRDSFAAWDGKVLRVGLVPTMGLRGPPAPGCDSPPSPRVSPLGMLQGGHPATHLK